MRAARFDTLEYAKKAKAAGFTQQQAEFQAETLEALAEILDKGLATKNDLSEAKNELKKEIELLNSQITSVENGLNTKIAALDSTLNTKIAALDSTLNTKIAAVDSKLTWLISLFGIVSVLIGLFNLWHALH